SASFTVTCDVALANEAAKDAPVVGVYTAATPSPPPTSCLPQTKADSESTSATDHSMYGQRVPHGVAPPGRGPSETVPRAVIWQVCADARAARLSPSATFQYARRSSPSASVPR